jgi:acetyl esterase/lipase
MRAARRIQEAAALSSLGPSHPSVIETMRQISLPNGAHSEVLLFQPKAPKTASPLIVLFHGGGFVVGNPSQVTAYGRSLCETYGAVVASIGYRLAPDFKSPAQAEDTWEGTKWITEHAESFGADPAKAGFIVGGVSAGGNLAASTVLRSLKTPLIYAVTGVWLAVPLLLGIGSKQIPEDQKDLWFSHTQNADVPILPLAGLEAFEKAWVPDFTDPRVTPFALQPQDLAKLKFPKTYVQACGMDPLRDDALVIERVLKKGGTETRINVYKGLPHASWAFLPMLKSSQVVVKDTMREFGWLLGVEEKEEDVKGNLGGA